MFEGEMLYDQLRKGKEYRNGRLEYEGEYLYYNKYNGKGYDKNGNISYEIRNGFGIVKEYYYDTEKIYFEGEYKDGIRNGNGKTFYDNGKIKYEAEFLNGKINGKGKKYYNNGILKYEGCKWKNERIRKIIFL